MRTVYSKSGTPRSAGFNLIEAAIVLGIVGLIVGGIWAAAGSAYENMRQQNASKQLLALVQGIRGFYAQNPSDVVNENITQLFELGVLPADMVVDTAGVKALRHQWGGAVTIESDNAGGIAAFRVNFLNMKRDVCRNFLTRSVNVAKNSGLLSVGNDAGATSVDFQADAGATLLNVDCPEDADPWFLFSLRG
jgi:hypothetical protein